MAEIRGLKWTAPQMHCHGAESSLTPYAHMPDLVANLRKLALEMSIRGYAGVETVASLAECLSEWSEIALKKARAEQSVRAEATRTFEQMWEGSDDEPRDQR